MLHCIRLFVPNRCGIYIEPLLKREKISRPEVNSEVNDHPQSERARAGGLNFSAQAEKGKSTSVL
jgi:hypothetical protein